jgi:hypothetical protein
MELGPLIFLLLIHNLQSREFIGADLFEFLARVNLFIWGVYIRGQRLS